MPVAEEVNFAYHLAANEPNVRRRAVSSLMKWISTKSAHVKTEFTEESMMKLWKGLFYCMWMTDKPLVQQEMADTICSLIHSFSREGQTLTFIDAFFKTMAHEWFAIDRYRIDKFMMLVRRFFRQSLVFTYSGGWREERIRSLNACLSKTVLHPSSDDTPVGLKMHIANIFLQELARVHGHELTAEQAMLFLEPFFKIIVRAPMVVLRKCVRDDIFHLMMDLDPGTAEQGAEGEGSDVEEEAMKVEKESDNEEEYDEDGRLLEKSETSVDLPAVPFDYEMIADRFLECSKIKNMKAPNRCMIANLVKKFWELSQGVNPRHSVEEDSGSELEIRENDIAHAAKKLKEEEAKEVMREKEELKKLADASAKSKKGGKFGLDTCSGVYEHLTLQDSSESGSDADTESADEEIEAVQPKKKLKQSAKQRGKQCRKGLQVTERGKKKCPATGRDEDDDMLYEDVLRHENERLTDVSLLLGAGETEGGKESAKKPTKRKKGAKVGSASGENSISTMKKKKVTSPDGDEDSKAQSMTTNENSPEIKGAKKKRRRRKKRSLPTGSCDASSAPGNVGEQASLTESAVTKNGVTFSATQDVAVSKNTESKNVNKRKFAGNQNTAKGKKVKERCEASLSTEQLPTPVLSAAQATSTHSSDALKTTVKAGQNGLHINKEKRKKRRKKLLNLNDCENDQLLIKGKKWLQPKENRPRPPLKEAPTKTGPQSSPSPGGWTVTEMSSSPSQKSLKKENESTQKDDTICQSGKLGESNAEVNIRLTPQKELKIKSKFALFGSATPTTKLVRQSHQRAQTERPKLKKKAALKRQSLSDSGKKVNFLLSRNRAQDPKEYLESLKASPHIPFDATKKPAQGVLKVRDHSKQGTPLMSTTPCKRRRASDFF